MVARLLVVVFVLVGYDDPPVDQQNQSCEQGAYWFVVQDDPGGCADEQTCCADQFDPGERPAPPPQQVDEPFTHSATVAA